MGRSRDPAHVVLCRLLQSEGKRFTTSITPKPEINTKRQSAKYCAVPSANSAARGMTGGKASAQTAECGKAGCTVQGVRCTVRLRIEAEEG